MTTLELSKTRSKPPRICESCLLESSEHLYTMPNGAYVCEDCANQEGEE